MNDNNQHVIITDIRMPFISMVMFMVKWVIASIPAFFILAILSTAFMAVFGRMAGTMNF